MIRLLDELKTVKSQVLYLLKRYEETRNNDFYLILLWLKIFGGLNDFITWIPKDIIQKLTSKPNTIWRMRQKIQNEEKRFTPTDPEVKRKRQERAVQMRKVIHQV